jgi:hypothetical protein
MILRSASEDSADEVSNNLPAVSETLQSEGCAWSGRFRFIVSASVFGPYLDGKAVDGRTGDRSSRCTFTFVRQSDLLMAEVVYLDAETFVRLTMLNCLETR